MLHCKIQNQHLFQWSPGNVAFESIKNHKWNKMMNTISAERLCTWIVIKYDRRTFCNKIELNLKCEYWWSIYEYWKCRFFHWIWRQFFGIIKMKFKWVWKWTNSLFLAETINSQFHMECRKKEYLMEVIMRNSKKKNQS